jgi:hypothetical protein
MKVPPLAHTSKLAARWCRAMLVIAALALPASRVTAQQVMTDGSNPTVGTDAGTAGDGVSVNKPGKGVTAPGNPATLGIPGTPAGFEIDGDLLGLAGGTDWFPGAGSGIVNPNTCAVFPNQVPAFFGRDNEWRQDVDGKFKTQSNKNNDNIDPAVKPWHWSTKGGNPQKNDITEIYGAARTDGQGFRWLIVGISTRAPQGDNHTDVEINQAGLRITGETEGQIQGLGPHNGRTIGDLLVVVDEVVGGRDPVPTLRRWNGTEFVLIPRSEWEGKYYAVHNVTQVPSPCPVVDRKGNTGNTYEPAQFIELAVRTDLTLNPDFTACGTNPTIMVKTRSSHSFTSELKDFALGGLGGPAGPACTITGPNTICAGNPVQLCGPPEEPGLTYLWNTGETTRCINVTSQGTYQLTLNRNGCPPQVCTKTLLASSAPVCTITGPEEICPGQTITLCAPEGFQGTQFTYQWASGQTTRCITVNQPGDYTVTVSTPECGSATCTKTVRVGETVACSISGPTDIDPDSTAQLCGPTGPGFTYLWSTNETTRCITIDEPGKYTLTVTSPECGQSTCTRVVADRPLSSCRCTIGYPDDSNSPRSQQAFVETAILRAVVPGRDGCPIGEQTLRLWYNDSDALGLGIRRVVVYNSPIDSTVTDYPVTPSPASPACVQNPQFGATNQTGLQTGNDVAVDGGRPIWPVLYVTDITFDKDARDGDWQQGGAAGIPADQVCGVWTSGVRRVLAYAGNQTIIRMDPDPAANGWNLGAGAGVPPGGFGAYPDEGYGAEVSWDLSALGLLPGHHYRLYTMIHDGSQSNVAGGGNVGHACTRVQVTQNGIIMPLGEDGGIGEDAIQRGAGRVSSEATVAPARFELAQNVPNPFAAGSRTSLRFALPAKSQVRIAVYTVSGQRVAVLADGEFAAGNHSAEWDGRATGGRTLSPGMYVCKMEASSELSSGFVTVRKMLMVK